MLLFSSRLPLRSFLTPTAYNYDLNKHLSRHQHINQLISSLIVYKLQGSEVKSQVQPSVLKLKLFELLKQNYLN